ncbi:MAG: hypothetical protein WAZ18_02535 [Alphaproteobacteria bacterium]
MSKELMVALTDLREKTEALAEQRRAARLQFMKEGGASGATLATFQMAGDVAAWVRHVKDLIEHDVGVYPPLVEFGLPEGELPKPVVSTEPAPTRGFVAQHMAHMGVISRPLYQGQGNEALPRGVRQLMAFITAEVNEVGVEAAAFSGGSGAYLNKLKNVLAAFQSQRYGDVHTVLKSILRNDPHNPMVLFLMAQFLYFMVSNGHKEMLPEAREITPKAMHLNEKLSTDKLAAYRYWCVVAEMAHDPARAMGWIREHGLLHVAPMKSEAGLWAGQGIGLKAWALMAKVDVALWSEAEFEMLKELVLDVVGGGMVYMALLRGRLQEASLGRKDPFPHIPEIEQALTRMYTKYMEVAPALTLMMDNETSVPWLVRQRYFQAIKQAAGKPMFDHVLLHVAVNGEHWAAGYPDAELHAALADPNTSYWRMWALTLGEKGEGFAARPLDAAEALQDASLFGDFNRVLDVLRAQEQQRIKHEVWNEVKPWLIRWQMDHLLAAGTGNSHPREALMPKAPLLRVLYRRWSQPQASGYVASEMIFHTAQHGAFAGVNEVLAALEGAYRLLDDPNHGLVATQKRALQAAKQQNPGQFGALSMGGDGLGSGAVLGMLLPVVLLGGVGAVFMLSKNMGQAIGLSLALAGFAGVALLGAAKK